MICIVSKASLMSLMSQPQLGITTYYHTGYPLIMCDLSYFEGHQWLGLELKGLGLERWTRLGSSAGTLSVTQCHNSDKAAKL
jgi:hypothetical protein